MNKENINNFLHKNFSISPTTFLKKKNKQLCSINQQIICWYKISNLQDSFWGINANILSQLELSKQNFIIILFTETFSGYLLNKNDIPFIKNLAFSRTDYKIHKTEIQNKALQFKNKSNLLEIINEYLCISTNHITKATPKKSEQYICRTIRESLLTKKIKKLYKNKCQICGTQLKTDQGTLYSEVHHIKPLSHQGDDKEENMICVCPNHHALLDLGGIKIPNKVLTSTKHYINQENINYQNKLIYKS